MADKSFSNELKRVLARVDAEELACDLQGYHEFWREIVEQRSERTEPYSGNPFEVQDPSNADRALAYVVLSASQYDDPRFLGFMSAGPLEDLLRDPTPEILHRVIAEAQETPRFRWMLSGVWLHAIADRAREPVQQVVGDWTLDETPLPQQPWF